MFQDLGMGDRVRSTRIDESNKQNYDNMGPTLVEDSHSQNASVSETIKLQTQVNTSCTVIPESNSVGVGINSSK